MSKPAVLITRPLSEAQGFSDLVAALGCEPVCEPLLKIEPVPQDFSGVPDALIATSPQAFNLTYPQAWKDVPLFVMGDSSARRAEAAGFMRVASSAGDFTRLMDLIHERVPADSRLYYLRGETVRHDLRAELPQHEIVDFIVYHAAPVRSLSPRVTGLLREGDIAVVTLFSPRSGQIFADLMRSAGLVQACRNIKVLCLSPAVLDSVLSLPWRAKRIADVTDQNGMADALEGWVTPAQL